MNLTQTALHELRSAHEFFRRSTRNLKEEHSNFRPTPKMLTAAQQIAHCAHTIEWFVEGAFGEFDLNFEAHGNIYLPYDSISAALAFFDQSVQNAKAKFELQTDDDWQVLIAPGPIMGGEPRFAVVNAISEHTAHHRGALTVYARLNGLVPPMPYMEM
jgi:uncharacterized damage-inducible protein DinB